MIGWVLASSLELRHETALRWWLQCRLYLRPGESDKLKVRSLVRPTMEAGTQYRFWGVHLHPQGQGSEPGKTGLWNEAVMMDSEEKVGLLLEQLVAGRLADAPLWMLSAEEDVHRFSVAAAAMRLERLRPSRYSLRHTGASEDLLAKSRSVLEVKQRDASLSRYGKTAHVQSEINKTPPDILAYGQRVRHEIEECLLGQTHLRLPAGFEHNAHPPRPPRVLKRPSAS